MQSYQDISDKFPCVIIMASQSVEYIRTALTETDKKLYDLGGL